MLVSGQSKAADLSSLLMIHSVATAFKSLLRPSDLISHDKGPAESLATVINEAITDVDKVKLKFFFFFCGKNFNKSIIIIYDYSYSVITRYFYISILKNLLWNQVRYNRYNN